MHAVGEQHRKAPALQVDPHARPRKAGVADAPLTHEVATAPALRHQAPTEAAPLLVRRRGTGVLTAEVLDNGGRVQASAEQRLRIATHTAQGAKQAGVASHPAKGTGVLVV